MRCFLEVLKDMHPGGWRLVWGVAYADKCLDRSTWKFQAVILRTKKVVANCFSLNNLLKGQVFGLCNAFGICNPYLVSLVTHWHTCSVSNLLMCLKLHGKWLKLHGRWTMYYVILARTYPRGGGRTGCAPHKCLHPAGRRPAGRWLAGAHFLWGLRMGLRAQQNTTIPSRGPLERARIPRANGSLERPGASKSREKRHLWRPWGPLELNGALGQQPIVS